MEESKPDVNQKEDSNELENNSNVPNPSKGKPSVKFEDKLNQEDDSNDLKNNLNDPTPSEDKASNKSEEDKLNKKDDSDDLENNGNGPTSSDDKSSDKSQADGLKGRNGLSKQSKVDNIKKKDDTADDKSSDKTQADELKEKDKSSENSAVDKIKKTDDSADDKESYSEGKSANTEQESVKKESSSDQSPEFSVDSHSVKKSDLLRMSDLETFEKSDVLRDCSSCCRLEPITHVVAPKCCGLFGKSKSISDFSEFWLISVPKEDNTWEKLNQETNKKNLSLNFKFHLPDFKKPVLDKLFKLSSQLGKLGDDLNETMRKLANYLKEHKDDDAENFIKINNLSPQEYLTRFTWNEKRFSISAAPKTFHDTIQKNLQDIGAALTNELNNVNRLKKDSKPYEYRNEDNLRHRYLGDIVKTEHFVQDSKFLTTLLVVVPRMKVKEWLESYENFSEMVIHESSKQIYDDGTDCLFTVTLAVGKVEDFKHKAHQNMFFVRTFKYSERDIIIERQYYETLIQFKNKEMKEVFTSVQNQFQECFEAWVHAKAIRLFLESVLRYGLEENFEAMLLVPIKSRTKLRKLLETLYSHLEEFHTTIKKEDIPASLAMFKDEDHYPYVFFNIDLSFVGTHKHL